MIIAAKNGFDMNAARPDEIRARGGRIVDWDAKFIKNLQTALMACRALYVDISGYDYSKDVII